MAPWLKQYKLPSTQVYEDLSSSSFKRFLQTHAINAEYTRLIMAHATNAKLKLKADEQPDIMNPDER